MSLLGRADRHVSVRGLDSIWRRRSARADRYRGEEEWDDVAAVIFVEAAFQLMSYGWKGDLEVRGDRAKLLVTNMFN